MVKTTVFLLGESAADRQRAFSTALGGRAMMPILSISSIMCHCEARSDVAIPYKFRVIARPQRGRGNPPQVSVSLRGA